jgi:outer membrane protein
MIGRRSSNALALMLIGTTLGGVAQQTSPKPASSTDRPVLLRPSTPEEQSGQQNRPAVGPLSAAQARAAAEKVDTDLPDVPLLPSISPQPAAPAANSASVQQAANSKTEPARDQATGLRPNVLGFLGPYRRPYVPELFPGNGERLGGLIRDGKLYLSLHDALALVIENNLEVQVERYNLQLAETDIVRTKGGGSARGIDYNIAESPQGIGGPGSPLLNSSQTSTNPIAPAIDDLTALNATTVTQNNLSQTGTQTYSAGPNIPYFDPSLIVESGYLQRSNIQTIGSSAGTGLDSGSTGDTSTPGTLRYVSANIAYLQGFSTGTQVEGTLNNDSQVVYSSLSQLNPFSTPSTSVTVTQPLLRGFGRGVNLRYLRIANLNRKISHLLFQQQLIDTIYGTSRLYYDLVSLGENIAVKQEALRAARKLYDDDKDQVDQGTLAPIELTRAQALLTSSEFDLVQAQGLYRQQEVILRNEIIRPGAPAFRPGFTSIVPTDRISVPEQLQTLNVEQLEAEGLANRPDLAQAHLQVKSGEISTQGSHNNALAQLNVYANVETRGSSEQSYEPLGSPGTGAVTIPQNLALGGLRTATIYQAGVQLTLPLRNRIAEADAARDTIQLRQSAARTERLEDQVREEIETGVIALQTAQAAYNAAVASRGYQQQLLDAESDKLAMGQSTNLLVVQNEAFLAQARSTEIAARSNWMKTRIALDRALGNLLEKNNIALDDAINGRGN